MSGLFSSPKTPKPPEVPEMPAPPEPEPPPPTPEEGTAEVQDARRRRLKMSRRERGGQQTLLSGKGEGFQRGERAVLSGKM